MTGDVRPLDIGGSAVSSWSANKKLRCANEPVQRLPVCASTALNAPGVTNLRSGPLLGAQTLDATLNAISDELLVRPRGHKVEMGFCEPVVAPRIR